MRTASWLVGLLVVSVTGAQPQPDSAGMNAALERLDIPEALRQYDAATAESGPSLELLRRVAWADLAYCIAEGKRWDRLQAARVLTAAGDELGRQALVDGLRSEHSAIRGRAAEWAADAEVAEAVTGVGAMASDKARPSYERLQALKALHRLGQRDRALRLAAELSRSEDVVTRRQASEALGAFQDPDAADALVLLLADADPQVRLTAAHGLLVLGEAAGRDSLLAALEEENPRVALEAAYFLGLAGDRSGLARVRRMVEQAMAEGADPDTFGYKIEIAVYILSTIDPQVAAPFLSRMAVSSTIGERLAAARRMVELGDAEALPALQEALAFEPTMPGGAPIRADAMRYAGWLGDRQEVRAMAERAMGDVHPKVRLEGLTVLARLGDEAVLPALRDLLGHPELRPRVEAAELVLDFGAGPAAAEPLRQPIRAAPDGS